MAAVALALAVAAPAAPQASNGARPDQAKPACSSQVEETTWTGNAVWKDGDIYDWTLTFRAGGVLAYSYRGSTYDNGRWSQRGVRINFDLNDHYADYAGRISGDTISGTQKNTTGNTGTWKVTRPCKTGPVS